MTSRTVYRDVPVREALAILSKASGISVCPSGLVELTLPVSFSLESEDQLTTPALESVLSLLADQTDGSWEKNFYGGYFYSDRTWIESRRRSGAADLPSPEELKSLYESSGPGRVLTPEIASKLTILRKVPLRDVLEILSNRYATDIRPIGHLAKADVHVNLVLTTETLQGALDTLCAPHDWRWLGCEERGYHVSTNMWFQRHQFCVHGGPIRVFRLEHEKPSDLARAILSISAPDSVDATALDEKRKLIVHAYSIEELENITALIQTLDQPLPVN
ncbi:MAG: hypothetical protein RLY93_12555 [Sumerlaeia bacterium]